MLDQWGPVHGCFLDVGELLERAVQERVGFADAFVLEQPDRGFRQGIIVSVSLMPDACQPRIAREKTSIAKATYTNPAHVLT